jgi:dihydropteroate synthase
MIVYPVRILCKEQAERLVERIGVEKEAVPLLSPKAGYKNILLRSVKTSWANIIKQEMLGSGGDAAINNKSYNCSATHTDILLMGNNKCFTRFLRKMKMQPECFSALYKDIERVVMDEPTRLRIAGKDYDLSKDTIVIGILNITPDSFSDGGKYLKYDDAFKRAEELLEQGANFIDVGGESTRPGSVRVSLQEEQDRILPIVESITRKFGPVVSVDSYKAALLKGALKAGAKMVNDVSSGAAVSAVAKDIMANDAAAIVMMNRSENDVAGSSAKEDTADPIAEFVSFCHETRDNLITLGLGKGALIMDPGIGFGLSDSDVNKMLKNAYSLSGSGFAVCWGISRKSFMGRTVGVELSERDGLSNAISLYLLSQGVKIFRTHDVAGLNAVIKFYKNLEGV